MVALQISDVDWPYPLLHAAALREPQCPNNSWSSPTATIFGDVHSLLAYWAGQGSLPAGFDAPSFPAAAKIAINNTNLASAVILGHSAGGRVANDIVTGETCCKPACLSIALSIDCGVVVIGLTSVVLTDWCMQL